MGRLFANPEFYEMSDMTEEECSSFPQDGLNDETQFTYFYTVSRKKMCPVIL